MNLTRSCEGAKNDQLFAKARYSTELVAGVDQAFIDDRAIRGEKAQSKTHSSLRGWLWHKSSQGGGPGLLHRRDARYAHQYANQIRKKFFS